MTAKRPKKISTYVVDASVAIKWFSDEEGSEKAKSLLRRHLAGRVNLVALDLLIYEVGNALARGKQLDPDSITDAIQFVRNARIDLFALSENAVRHAARLCNSYKLTFYDASYASLAADLDVPLISADAKGHKRITDIAVKML